MILLTALAAASCAAPARPAEARDARSSADFREHFQRGLELYRQGLLEGALAEFKACLLIDEDVAALQFQVGRILLQRALKQAGRFDVAADRLERALRLDPSHAHAKLLLAEIYKRRVPGTYRPLRATSLYEEILKEHPDRFDIRLDYAQWLTDGEVRLVMPGDPNRVTMDSAWSLELARAHLETVLDQAPPGSDALVKAQHLTADALMRMGDFDAARKRYEFILSSYEVPPPERARILQKAGHCRLRLKDHGAAAAAFRRAHETDPRIEYLWDVRMAYEPVGGYPADLPASLRFDLRPEPVDPRNPPLLKFTDLAPKLGIDKWAGAGPSAWADVDGDGREDLLACGCDTFCTLWRNDGASFTDVTLKAGLTRLESGFGAVFADYDDDGDADFYVARNGWNGPAPNSLMRNDGEGIFTDVIAGSGADAPGSSFNAAWADFNRDGRLDLIVTQGVTADGSVNRLFFGRGVGAFTDVTEKSGILEPPHYGTIGVAVGDYDGDGWLDIFTHGRLGPNRLFRNLGNGAFKDVAREAGVAGAANQNGYVAFFSDLDADGDLDIFAASLEDWPRVLQGYRPGYRPGSDDDMVNTPRFWRNEGGGRFADRTREAGLIHPYGVMSGGIADLDNDGYPDVYLGTGNPDFHRLEPNVLLRNVSGTRFEEMTRYAGVGSLGKGHGISFTDWDRDGDLDIYIELGGFYHGDFWHSAFYVNDLGNRNNWLQVTLEQAGANRRAIGAGVTIRDGAYRFYQEVKGGEGFGSTSPTTLHFGIGRRSRVEAMEIRWPDGTRTVLADPPVRKRLRVKKGDASWRVE
jgi:Tfp pilus assembly protein PilF